MQLPFEFFHHLFPLFLILGILPFFLILGFKFFRGFAGLSAGRDWSETTGQILASTLQMRQRRGFSHSAYPLVLYQYQVQGHTFQGQRIHFGAETGGWGARSTVARYPVGKTVPVFYNPFNPSDAVLEKKAPANWVLLLVMAVMALLLLSGLGFRGLVGF